MTVKKFNEKKTGNFDQYQMGMLITVRSVRKSKQNRNRISSWVLFKTKIFCLINNIPGLKSVKCYITDLFVIKGDNVYKIH